jgi:hypothetical protein
MAINEIVRFQQSRLCGGPTASTDLGKLIVFDIVLGSLYMGVAAIEVRCPTYNCYVC